MKRELIPFEGKSMGAGRLRSQRLYPLGGVTIIPGLLKSWQVVQEARCVIVENEDLLWVVTSFFNPLLAIWNGRILLDKHRG